MLFVCTVASFITGWWDFPGTVSGYKRLLLCLLWGRRPVRRGVPTTPAAFLGFHDEVGSDVPFKRLIQMSFLNQMFLILGGTDKVIMFVHGKDTQWGQTLIR